MTRRENTENLNEIIQELRANIARAESDIRNLVDDRLKLVEALSELLSMDNRALASDERTIIKQRCAAILRDLGEAK